MALRKTLAINMKFKSTMKSEAKELFASQHQKSMTLNKSAIIIHLICSVVHSAKRADENHFRKLLSGLNDELAGAKKFVFV